MEIQSVLSPDAQGKLSFKPSKDGNTKADAFGDTGDSAAATPTIPQPVAVLSSESIKEMALVISSSLVNVLNDRGVLPPESSVQNNENSDSEFIDEEDYESDSSEVGEGIDVLRELPKGRPNQMDRNNVPVFGVNINEGSKLHRRKVVADIHVPSVSVDPNPPVSPNPPVIVPDKTLPSVISTRAPTNWYPDLEVMAWGCEMADKSEWTSADREIIEKQLSPDPQHDHLFTAVAPPPGMLAKIQSTETRKKDYNFRRAATEEYLVFFSLVFIDTLKLH